MPETGSADTLGAQPWRLTRRGILQIGGLGAAAAAAGGAGLFAATSSDESPRPVVDEVVYRTIPGTGESLPAVGLGTFQTFDAIPEDARATRVEVLRRFWEAGGRVVDVSPLYGLSEENIARFTGPAGVADQVFLTNKIWSTGEHLWDPSHAERSLSRSMERLGRTEPIDVMQCHSLVNVEMIVPILHAWKAEGLVRRIGVTHHDPAYFAPLTRWIQTGDVDFVQTRYSIAQRRAEDDVIPAAVDNGVAVLVNMPLEKARLHNIVGDRPLPDFAQEIGVATWSQYFLKWVLANPGVTAVLPATSNPGHLDDNMAAGRGDLPDAALRARMVEHMQSIPGFDTVTSQPWYPGKTYPGVVNRGMRAIQARSTWRPAGSV